MRILSLAPSNTEILYALGLGDRVVGVTHMCDYPDEVDKKKRVGSWTSTSLKDIRSVKPDVIFTSYYFPPELKSYNGPGEVVHLEPRTLGDILSSIRTIGAICGRKDAAEELVGALEQELFDYTQAFSFAESGPVVYAEEWGKPPMVAGNWVPQMIRLAGGHQPFIGPGEASRRINLSELQEADPDLIILHWCGAGSRTSPDDVKSRPGWDILRAVRSGRVYSIDDRAINRPGPRIVDGIHSMRDIFQKDQGLHS
ncbi:MAG: cobalamin-binding protein [Parcubacteria group bacterium]